MRIADNNRLALKSATTVHRLAKRVIASLFQCALRLLQLARMVVIPSDSVKLLYRCDNDD